MTSPSWKVPRSRPQVALGLIPSPSHRDIRRPPRQRGWCTLTCARFLGWEVDGKLPKKWGERCGNPWKSMKIHVQLSSWEKPFINARFNENIWKSPKEMEVIMRRSSIDVAVSMAMFNWPDGIINNFRGYSWNWWDVHGMYQPHKVRILMGYDRKYTNTGVWNGLDNHMIITCSPPMFTTKIVAFYPPLFRDRWWWMVPENLPDTIHQVSTIILATMRRANGIPVVCWTIHVFDEVSNQKSLHFFGGLSVATFDYWSVFDQWCHERLKPLGWRFLGFSKYKGAAGHHKNWFIKHFYSIVHPSPRVRFLPGLCLALASETIGRFLLQGSEYLSSQHLREKVCNCCGSGPCFPSDYLPFAFPFSSSEIDFLSITIPVTCVYMIYVIYNGLATSMW